MRLRKIMILILFSIIYSIGCITQPITFAASTSHSSYKINRYSKPIPIEQLKIGGVGIGDSLDYVKSIYGEPSIVGKKVKNYLYEGITYDVSYGDSFLLKVLIESDGTENIVNINSTANNGLAMPCGIKVGSPIGDMYKKFGMPWRTNFKKDGTYSYAYRTDYTTKILFTTNKDHLITRIDIIGME